MSNFKYSEIWIASNRCCPLVWCNFNLHTLCCILFVKPLLTSHLDHPANRQLLVFLSLTNFVVYFWNINFSNSVGPLSSHKSDLPSNFHRTLTTCMQCGKKGGVRWGESCIKEMTKSSLQNSGGWSANRFLFCCPFIWVIFDNRRDSRCRKWRKTLGFYFTCSSRLDSGHPDWPGWRI